MNNTSKHCAQTIKPECLGTAGKWLALFLSMSVLTACGEVDSGDGEYRDSITLPTDSVLTLFCPDAGIANEPCILNDPDNPYASTPITDDNKFDLHNAAPSAKARFYLWATAQAMSPRGENQYFVGKSLHQMFAESGSELARDQALRAYRSVLDNYFNSVTFYGPFTVAGEEFYTPQSLRKLVGQHIYGDGLYEGSEGLENLFNTNPKSNSDLAQGTFGEWGYTYTPGVIGPEVFDNNGSITIIDAKLLPNTNEFTPNY